ncbi:MAG: acylphosphatase, partial [Kiritimatiellia bacterium]|nr:acylphosphatase [Kiritimatiellia bacterium]
MKRMQRVRLRIEGRVQGVGFRPAVYRLARRFSLTGFVNNTSFGVLIEAQGPGRAVAGFISSLQSEKPRQAIIESLRSEKINPRASEKDFSITESRRSGDVRAGMPPDLAICALCRQELFDPANRRSRYPFINCTDCGPRFSIIRSLPYDRERTTMESFRMCPHCRAEFINPLNRRFEAQPNACPVCGP